MAESGGGGSSWLDIAASASWAESFTSALTQNVNFGNISHTLGTNNSPESVSSPTISSDQAASSEARATAATTKGDGSSSTASDGGNQGNIGPVTGGASTSEGLSTGTILAVIGGVGVVALAVALIKRKKK